MHALRAVLLKGEFEHALLAVATTSPDEPPHLLMSHHIS